MSIGHDLSEAEWAGRVQEALDRFAHQPYILQEFHKAARRTVRYYDFHRDEVVPMRGSGDAASFITTSSAMCRACAVSKL